MSGQAFVNVLSGLGYKDVDAEDGESFDWIFEDDTILPFLDWFCAEVQPGNKLDPKDFEEFLKLEESSEGILDGCSLEIALQNLNLTNDEEMSDEKLKQEIAQLEEDLKSCQRRKDMLIQQRNKLSMHKTNLGDRMNKLDSVSHAAKTQCKHELEQVQADNSKMNSAIDSLLQSVTDLCSLYKSKSSDSEDQPSVFLSQLSLENLYKAEEKFTGELTNFTKKQFFEGIADVAGDSQGSLYEFLEINNPKSLLILGEKESTILEACREISRLQVHHPESEVLRVNAQIQDQTSSTACEFTEKKQTQLKTTPYPKDIAQLNNKLKDAQTTLSILKHDLRKLGEEEVPSLIKDSAALQVTRILQGNYDLKIARQDYFMTKQEQVIDMLLTQRARNEFLTIAFELESKGHRDSYRLLTSINMLLQEVATNLQARMMMLKDPMLSITHNQRSTLDSRDKFFTKLHELLDPQGFTDQKQQLFVTYTQLVESAETLQHQLSSLRASANSSNHSQDNRCQALEKAARNCESTLYESSSTLGGQPLLSPQPIVESLAQLDSMLKQLEKAITDLMTDVDTKKRSLLSDPMLATERELFICFHTDPDRLRRIIEDVTQRLNAKLVK